MSAAGSASATSWRGRLQGLAATSTPPRWLVALSLSTLALEYGFDLGRLPLMLGLVVALHGLVATVTAGIIVMRLVRAPRQVLGVEWGDVVTLGLVLVGALALEPRLAGATAAVRNLWRVALLVLARGPQARLLAVLMARPMGLLAASFVVLIAVGTLALMAPASTRDGDGASLLTALFTATSAACVTGLAVVDTGAHFSRFGQWVILALIQLGGLGIMTITTALAMAFGGRLSARLRGAMHEILEEATVVGFRRLVLGIVSTTFVCEALGAASLYPVMTHAADGAALAASDRWFHAVFHSVSAFCNAGFGLYPDSLTRFASSPGPSLTIMALVVVGGLGFPVLIELLRPSWLRSPRRWLRTMSLHTRIALVTSAGLIGVGGVVFLLAEWSGALAPLSGPARPLAALFHSVMVRSAGYNSFALDDLHPVTMMVSMALMFIGGSPSGTAGGIKTTTFAVMVLALRAMVTQRREVEAFRRTIDKNNVYRAVAVTMISGLVLFGAVVLLLTVESEQRFDAVLFEAVSAFGTVGLSTGITPELSVTGKLLLVALMFVGRIGTFTVALAVGERERADYDYPAAKIIVG